MLNISLAGNQSVISKNVLITSVLGIMREKGFSKKQIRYLFPGTKSCWKSGNQ